MKGLYQILVILSAVAVVFGAAPLIDTLYQWKVLEFAYENETMRAAATESGDFVFGASVLMDVDVFYKNNPQGGIPSGARTIFVTIPRLQNGVPATFGIVTNNKYNGENMIEPYPAWSWHRNIRNCNTDRLVSVFKMKIDECRRLWVVDSGRIGDDIICPPQLLTFDLQTNSLINRIDIPKGIYEPTTTIITPNIDVRDPGLCKDTFVYIADMTASSLVVYDMRNNQLWKVTDKSMAPNPNYENITIEGESYNSIGGVAGLALEEFRADNPNKDRILYYQTIAGVTESKVYTSILRNQSRFANNASSSPEEFYTYNGTRSSQSDSMAINREGIIYFGLLTEVSIGCWNTRQDYGGKNIHTVYQNSETMQFPSGVKMVTTNKFTEELWIVTNRMQKLSVGTMSTNETNFRISMGSMTKLLQNSDCLK